MLRQVVLTAVEALCSLQDTADAGAIGMLGTPGE